MVSLRDSINLCGEKLKKYQSHPLRFSFFLTNKSQIGKYEICNPIESTSSNDTKFKLSSFEDQHLKTIRTGRCILVSICEGPLSGSTTIRKVGLSTSINWKVIYSNAAWTRTGSIKCHFFLHVEVSRINRTTPRCRVFPKEQWIAFLNGQPPLRNTSRKEPKLFHPAKTNNISIDQVDPKVWIHWAGHHHTRILW